MGRALSESAQIQALADIESIREQMLASSLIEHHLRAEKALRALGEQNDPLNAGLVLCRIAEDLNHHPIIRERLNKLGSQLLPFTSVTKQPHSDESSSDGVIA